MTMTATGTVPATASEGKGKPQRTPAEPVMARLLGGLALLAVLAAVAGLLITGSGYEEAPRGLPDAGPIVGWGLPIADTLTFVLSMATVGWLILAAFLDPAARNGNVSRRGRRAVVCAAWASALWCAVAIIAAALSMADVLGVPMNIALRPETISTYGWDITNVRTLLISAGLALIVSIGCFLSAKLSTVTAWLAVALVAISVPGLAGHAAGLGNHALAITSGIAHIVAATVWVGGVLALGMLAFGSARTTAKAKASAADSTAAADSDDPEAAARLSRAATIKARLATEPAIAIAAERFSPLALACVAVLLISGLFNAFARLETPSDLLYSGYGQVVLIKSILLLALIGAGLMMRTRILPQLAGAKPRGAFAKLALVEVSLMAISTGLGVALSQSAPTRPELLFSTTGESLLGFAFPPPPDLSTIILGWQFDPLFMAIGIAGSAFYIAGVMRLRARGDSWPVARTICFLTGMGIVIWATNAGIATYSQVSVGMHMIDHMVLTMMAPIPIVLGAPVTLALRAINPSPSGGRGPRELLMSGLHSRVAIVLTSPIFVLIIYAVGLYGLYFTPLFGYLMSSHIGHIAMTSHFLLTGLLLAYVVIGIDPRPRPLGYPSKLLLVLSLIVLHTFFAVALMSTSEAIGVEWFSQVQPPWVTDLVKDSALGGQIAWGVGEIPTLVLMLIIAVQWSRSDERESKRRDRYTSFNGDVELDDYNDYLAHLNEVNERYEARRNGTPWPPKEKADTAEKADQPSAGSAAESPAKADGP